MRERGAHRAGPGVPPLKRALHAVRRACRWLFPDARQEMREAWFWTREWQQGEREVDEHIAAGRTERFSSVDEFLAALNRDAAEAARRQRGG
jgi:hypothetical protein